MGNTNTAPQDYITYFMPRICTISTPMSDIRTELNSNKHKRPKHKSMKSTKSKSRIKKREKINRKIVPIRKKRVEKELSNIKSCIRKSNNRDSLSKSDTYSLSYAEGYITTSTVSTRSNTVVTNNYTNNYKIYNEAPPLWKQSASIPEVYRDDASLILDTLRVEKERVSGEHWLDTYSLDTLYIRNDFDYKWLICKIIQMNDNSVCIYNNISNQYEWIDKRSSKIKPHPSYINNDDENERNSLYIYQIKLQNPFLLGCHPDKILYYYDYIMNREYIICCTEYNTFNSEYAAGVYRYDINYHSIEYLGKYPISPKNYFKATMDNINQQLHIYCFPTWSILDLKSKQWNVTNMSDSVKYNLINIQVTSSIIVNGILYIFGNGRFAKFDEGLMMFREIGFPGIENKYIWEVNDIIHINYKELDRIYIFGLSDSHPSFERMWYKDIYYINVNEKKLIKWKKLKIKLPYYTYGVFADYSVVVGFKYFLFVFYHKLKELWIFDLLFNKRFRYNKLIKIELMEYCKIIINKNNIIHSLCLDDNGPMHIKLSLHQLLKNELNQYALRLKADLVCGYIKQICDEKHIPLSCKTVIFNYYPQVIDI